MADDKDGVSPTDSGPTSPGLPADGGRNVAVDYIKARYEGGPKPKESPAANVPKVFREPKKLDFQWDKIVDENAKKETGLPVGFKEQDLLQMVFTLTGVDTKSQYLSALETQQPVAKDEKQKAEIESLGDITKSVRRIFESGQIPSSSDNSAGSAAKTNEPLNADEIQRGMAKSLLSQWTRIGTDGTSSTSLDRAVPPPQLSIRPTYEQTAGSGVFENQPATLDGVVRSSDQVDEQVIQRGTTRSLLGQWNTINSPDQLPTKNGPSGSRSVKLTYESTPGSGVFENEPSAPRGDVVREVDANAEGEQIQRGFTKSLLSQWQNKGTEDTQQKKYPSKLPIKLVEGEGHIAENEPIRRSDVVRADDVVDEGEQVRRGMAKSLVNEWKTKGTGEFKAERRPINVAEGEGKVLESEPIRRTDVVREDDPGSNEGDQIQRGTTRMLLDQWKSIGTYSRQMSSKERTPIVLAEGDGYVAENEPQARRDDVAREDDASFTETERIQRGLAKSLRSQWQNIGSADAGNQHKERTPININEGEGKVLENEPIRRSDVVRCDDDAVEEVKIERGTTRNLLSQWKNKSNEEFRSVRKSIVLNEDDGRIAENEPTKRPDVVREDDAIASEGDQIQRGLARNRLSQWQNKASEEFRPERKSIILAEAEGCVAENEPARRDDVVREMDSDANGEQVQRGLTKSLLSQWKTMGTNEYQVPKRQIVLAEGEERIAENEPIRRTDVIRADDAAQGDDLNQVARGTTKSLLNRWNSRTGSEEPRQERKPIVLAEDEGRVLESEPVRRSDVVREGDDDGSQEAQIQRGTTKSLLQQWKNKPNEETKLERRPIILAEAEGAVCENNPSAQRDDVVRSSSDYTPDQLVVEKGLARNLRQQWTQKGSEEFRKEKTPIVVFEGEGSVAENEPAPRRTDVVREDLDHLHGSAVERGEGYVAENEPIRRDDVVRSDDPTNPNETVELPQRGQARQLREQWATIGTSGGSRDATPKPPINIYEESPVASTGSSGVIENQPAARRTDVVREDDEVDADLIALRRGNVSGGGTRQVRGYWTAPRQEQSLVSREKLELEALRASGTWATGSDAAGAVFENEPVRLEGVVRAGDPVDTGPSVERGIAKQLVNRYLSQPSETTSKQPFRLDMDVNLNEASIYENQPVQLQGVTRSSEQVEDVIGLRGQARNLAQRYATAASVNDDGSKKPPEMIKIDLADGPSVLESTPAELPSYVVRSDDYQPDAWKAGLTRDMLARWNSQRDLEGASGAGGVSSGGKPAWQLELEMTPQGSGVFENEPVVRSDVIREDDRAPDMIPVRQTRRTRAMWSRREREELEGPQVKEAPTREMIRFTPPRERSPPAVCATDEPFKSVQRITLQSSGTSTPSRSETPARGGGTGRAGTVTPGTSSSGVHSPQISQPGTPGATGLPPTPSNWTPSATDVATSARNRARISDEVMQWHARRLSRSVSIEENMALTGAVTSSMTSPTSGTPAAPGTPTSDRTFNGGDWVGHYEQQSHQQPVVQQVESHYQSNERQQPEVTAAPQQNGNGISSIHDNYVTSDDGAMANQYAVRYSDDAQTTSSAGAEYIDSGSYSVTAATAAAINSTPYGDYGSQNCYQHQQPSHQEQQQHQQTFQWLPETGSSNVVGNGTNSAYGEYVTNDYAPNQYDDTANQQQQLQPQFPSYDTLTADDIDKYYRTYDEQTQSQYNNQQPQLQQQQQQQPQQYHDAGVDGYNSGYQYDPYGGYQTSQPQNNSTFQYPSTDYYQDQPLDQGQGQYYDQGQGQGHYYDQDRGQQYDQGQVQYYDRDQYDYQYQQYQVPQQLTADDQYQPSTVKSSATLVFKPSSSSNTSGFN